MPRPIRQDRTGAPPTTKPHGGNRMTNLSRRPPDGGSPFDSIRQVRPDGTEFWSARDLSGLSGYDRWENFESAIERAKVSAQNQGQDTETLFRGVTKKGAGRPQADVELSRLAAYLTVMNGDPRKSEVAAAQAYFAIQTRIAETTNVFEIPTNLGDALRLAADKHDALVQAQQQILELEGPASQAETFRAAEGLCTVGDVANRFQDWALQHHPNANVKQQQVFDHAGRLGILIRGNTIRHNQGTSQAIKAGWIKHHRVQFNTNTRGMQTKVTVRLTPRGEARLWDGLVAWLQLHPTLDIKDTA